MDLTVRCDLIPTSRANLHGWHCPQSPAVGSSAASVGMSATLPEPGLGAADRHSMNEIREICVIATVAAAGVTGPNPTPYTVITSPECAGFWLVTNE